VGSLQGRGTGCKNDGDERVGHSPSEGSEIETEPEPPINLVTQCADGKRGCVPWNEEKVLS